MSQEPGAGRANRVVLLVALVAAVGVTWFHWRRAATANQLRPVTKPQARPEGPAGALAPFEPARSGPGRITCGATACDLASTRCCYPPTADPACVARGERCPGGGVELACDETRDCASPQLCCSRGGSLVCAATCGGLPEHQYCADDSECLEGRCVRGACRLPSSGGRLKPPLRR